MAEDEDQTHSELSDQHERTGDKLTDTSRVVAENPSVFNMKENNCNMVTEDISRLEELFKDRYTNADADYVKTLNTRAPVPPCVSDWYSRPRRSYDYTRLVLLYCVEVNFNI